MLIYGASMPFAVGLQPQLNSSAGTSNALFACCMLLGTGFFSARAQAEGLVFPVNTHGE